MFSIGTPTNWCGSNLANLAEYINGFAFNEDYWSNVGLPIVRIAQITGSQGIVDRYNGPLSPVFRLENGDIVFSWSGTLVVTRWYGGPAWLNQHLFKVVPRIGVHPAFLFHVLRASVAEMDKRTHGSTMKHIKRRELSEFAVAIPVDLAEQQNIALVLDTLDRIIRQTEAITAKLKQIKEGLLNDLLTRGIDANGELRPQHSEAPHCYKNSPLGTIPREWRMARGGEVCTEIVVGIVVRPTQYYCESGVPILRSANVREEGLILNDLVYMSNGDHQALQKSAVRPGDVLTVRTGYPGTSCVVDDQLSEANCVDIIISRPRPELVARFWAMWINSAFGKEQILRVQGGLAQQHFNVGELAAMWVAVPPMKEQDAIVERLSSLNARIQAEDRSVGVLRQVKTGLVDDLLTGRVRFVSSSGAGSNG